MYVVHILLQEMLYLVSTQRVETSLFLLKKKVKLTSLVN